MLKQCLRAEGLYCTGAYYLITCSHTMSKNNLFKKCFIYILRDILHNSVLSVCNIPLSIQKRTGQGHWWSNRTWDYMFHVKTLYSLERWFLLHEWGSELALLFCLGPVCFGSGRNCDVIMVSLQH